MRNFLLQPVNSQINLGNDNIITLLIMPGLLDLQPAVTRNNDLLRSQVINIYRYKSAKIKSKLRKKAACTDLARPVDRGIV